MTTGKKIMRCCIVLLFALLAACAKSDRAMPPTRENIQQYKNKLIESQNDITTKDRERARTSPEGAARLFRKTFVEPMEELGFSYDKTVNSFAERIVDGKLPKGDPELKTQVEGIIVMAKSTGDFAVKNGFISGSTKKLLDRINVR